LRSSLWLNRLVLFFQFLLYHQWLLRIIRLLYISLTPSISEVFPSLDVFNSLIFWIRLELINVLFYFRLILFSDLISLLRNLTLLVGLHRLFACPIHKPTSSLVKDTCTICLHPLIHSLHPLTAFLNLTVTTLLFFPSHHYTFHLSSHWIVHFPVYWQYLLLWIRHYFLLLCHYPLSFFFPLSHWSCLYKKWRRFLSLALLYRLLVQNKFRAALNSLQSLLFLQMWNVFIKRYILTRLLFLTTLPPYLLHRR
jgi:hypothetical protein